MKHAPLGGALRLRDGPDWIEIRCEECDRYGRYRKTNLLAKYGDDAAMPDILRATVKPVCPNYSPSTAWACRALFVHNA